MISQLQDSLDLAREIVQKLPNSYWADKEPWKIAIMAFTVLVLHGIEPVIAVLMWRHRDFREWMKKMAEDSDNNPNLRDLIQLVLIFLIWCSGRAIIIAGIWMIIFHEDQLSLIASLSGFIVGLLGSSWIAGKTYATSNLPSNNLTK